MSLTGPLRLFLSVTVTVALLLPSTIVAQQPRSDPGWPCKGAVDPAYVNSAEATGGVVLLLKPSEFEGVAAEMRGSDRHDEVVFRASGELADGEYEFDVPLDSTIESAYFFVSVQCLRAATLIRPSGDQLRADAAGVEYHGFEAVRLFTIPQPAPGPWKVRIAGRGFFTVLAKAATEVSLSEVAFPTRELPVKREPQRLRVRMDGAIRDIAFHFIAPSGATIAQLPLQLEEQNDDSRTYAGEVMPPAGDFRVGMTGIDQNGFRVQRVDEWLSVK